MLCDELSALTAFEVPPRPRFWRLFFISGRYKTAETAEEAHSLDQSRGTVADPPMKCKEFGGTATATANNHYDFL